MKRRTFLTSLLLGSATLAGCNSFTNPCRPGPLPKQLQEHDIVTAAWKDLDPQQIWDVHVHLIGTGDDNSGCWVNPEMDSWANPLQHISINAYKNASCINSERGEDKSFVEQLLLQMEAFPTGAKLLLLAFDHFHDEDGKADLAKSFYHTPNSYAARLAQAHPDRFRWLASIHPYRPDAITALKQAAADGAQGVKWLPQAMGIDPASDKCSSFYRTMAQLGLPLLCHSGEERAVHGYGDPGLANPLRLRAALDAGVKVIVAHCASAGDDFDLDAQPVLKVGEVTQPKKTSFELFLRMLDNPQYKERLFGDISATTLVNRDKNILATLLNESSWHEQLLNGSDYPLPGIPVVINLTKLQAFNFITADEKEILSRIREYNPLLFDFVLKRTLKNGKNRFSPKVFSTARIFPGAANL